VAVLFGNESVWISKVVAVLAVTVKNIPIQSPAVTMA
jgi:hypothetical protein